MSDEQETELEPTQAQEVELDDLSSAPATIDEPDSQALDAPDMEDGDDIHTGQELEAVFDVPVNVQAVLGKSALEVNQLLKLSPGAVIELDRKVGEAIDIYVNDRLVARGEVVMVEDHLGVTMTEIIKAPRK
ncbi:MAG: flagellar motor switch protein FliN [Pseudomonadota bacterium]